MASARLYTSPVHPLGVRHEHAALFQRKLVTYVPPLQRQHRSYRHLSGRPGPQFREELASTVCLSIRVASSLHRRRGRLSEHLVQGVDVWINTPRRPWEASGTSGMKVLVNGGLNLSELDGWWAEAYSREVGWALGDGREHGDDPSWDASEAKALYDLLERELIPEFYRRDRNGVPTEWTARIRESMARLTPYYSANRSVREYTDRYYVPAAAAYRERAADNGAVGEQVVAWRRMLDQRWPFIRFGDVTVDTPGDMHVIDVQVYSDDLTQNAVRVELYADGVDGNAQVRQEMMRGRLLAGSPGGWLYSARVPADRPASDYTARVIPQHPGVAIPLEDTRILWQR